MCDHSKSNMSDENAEDDKQTTKSR